MIIPAVVAVSSLLVLAQQPHDHSWYPPACCEGEHCKAVPCADLRPDERGNLRFKTRLLTRYGGDAVTGRKPSWEDRTIVFPPPTHGVSPDQRCHACVVNGLGRCVFVPAGIVKLSPRRIAPSALASK